MADLKPWLQDPPPPRRTAPEPLGKRPPDYRMRGESLAAYKAFLGYLRCGSIRATAADLGKTRSLLARYSRRWQWPRRRNLILAQHASRWENLAEYEERHNLPPAVSEDDLTIRKLRAFTEIEGPRIDRQLREALEEMPADSDPLL
jgi:hypothetical protein